MLNKLKLRLRALFHRNQINDELALHLEQLTDELIAQGLSPNQARSAAQRQFGNVTRLQEQSHDLFSFGLLDDLLRDLQYGWRSIRRTPSVAVAAVLSMGLAIGVNTVVFSLIQEVFFAKPTTRAAEELVTIELGESSHASLPNLRDLDASGGFDKVAGFDVDTAVNWRRGDSVRQIPVMLVSENYFDLLEARPALGRAFTKLEARAELNPHLVLLTHRLWTRTFDQDPAVVGTTMVLNGRPYTILGVLPQGFRPPTFMNALPDLYVPASLELNPSLLMRQSHSLKLFARRKPGQTFDQAVASTQVIASGMARDNPRENKGIDKSVRVLPIVFADPDAAPIIAFAAVLMVAVFVVLWIACVNIAGVLIARAAARRREIATRLAIGASRARLVRQLLTEALLLAGMGTVAGLSLHWYLTHLLNEWSLPIPIPIAFQIEPDFNLALYATALTLIATVLSGLVPALQATKPGLTSGLKMEEPHYGDRKFTFRNGLIVAQVAITVVLVSVALLFARSLARVNSMDPGFDLKHTVWAKVNLVNDRYAKDRVFLFASQMLETASSLPGVQSAALTEAVPFNNFLRSAQSIHSPAGTIKADYFENSVSPAYFETMRISLVAGRPFAANDRKEAPNVVILNQALASHLFGDLPAVGKLIWFGDTKQGPGVEVVGVAANSKHFTLGESQAFAVYHPILRTQPDKTEIHLIVRSAGDPASVLVPFRQAISKLDDTAAIDVGPLRGKLAFAYLPSQIGTVFLGSLGALGLMLALIGIYGAMTFAVSRRTAEIGIRMALGASRAQVLRAILGTSFSALGAGLLIGIGLSLSAAQPLSLFLADGITLLDPITFGSVILICLMAGAIAALFPALRALSIDPMRALRTE